MKGDPAGAIADYRKAIVIDPKYAEAYNSLAWLLATSPRDDLRNGKQAVEYALKGAELTAWKNPGSLETLAAAYAEARNFRQAIKWQTRALTFPEAKDDEPANQRLKLYQQRRPFRDQ